MFNPDFLYHNLTKLSAAQEFWIAYSGGLDSHTLLHAMAALREQNPQWQLHAIHVNHALHSAAHEWAEHCQRVCTELQIPITIVEVQITQSDELGVEAAARLARYQAFANELPANACLLTAHTMNDQAETMLLQSLRGAGPKGLAAMPNCVVFAAGTHARPLLNIDRKYLQDYAQQQQLNWINDPSNINTRFDRNYLRHEILPKLLTRWPSALTTLTRSAMHCANANDLLTELAIIDWQQVQGANNTIIISKLLTLSCNRQQNVLRWWLHNHLQLPLPPTTKLLQIQQELLSARVDAQPEVIWSGAEVRRHRDHLHAFTPRDISSLTHCIAWDLRSPLVLPDKLGTLTAKTVHGQGMVIPNDLPLTIRFRQGGERCHPVGRSGSHPLKKLLQEWNVAPWERDAVPLIYIGNELAMVVGYCVDKQFAAKFDQDGIVIE